jgi:hypothetical protein
MKHKSPLVLMEQLIMVLVFALTAAMCVGMFMKANQTSRDTQFRDGAVLVAQNGAEALKNSSGDLEEAARILEGTLLDGTLQVESEGYLMVITLVDSGTSGLGQAEICVSMDGILIYTLRTGWQEVGE